MSTEITRGNMPEISSIADVQVVTTNTRSIWLGYDGGTVGSIQTAKGLKPAETGDELLTSINAPDGVEVTLVNLPNPQDSTNRRYGDRIAVARAIEQDYRRYDGFGVLLGTDSVAEACGALTLILGESLQKPLVAISSQNTLAESGGDTRMQLESGIRVIRHFASPDPSRRYVGVFGIANGHVYDGSRLRKRNEADLDFLYTPGREAVADARPHILTRGDLLAPYHRYDARRDARGLKIEDRYEPDVAMIKVTGDTPPTVVRALAESGALRGLIIEALGSGNIPNREVEGQLRDHETRQILKSVSNIISEIKRATELGMFVGITSPFDDGRVDLTRYQLGQLAAEAGAIGMASLTPAFGDMKVRQALGIFKLPENYEELTAEEQKNARDLRNADVEKYLQTDMFGEMLPGIEEE